MNVSYILGESLSLS